MILQGHLQSLNYGFTIEVWDLGFAIEFLGHSILCDVISSYVM